MARHRQYHVLIAQEETGAAFAIQFGDYDYATVKDELDHYRYDQDYKASQLAIVTAIGDTQADCDAAVFRFNARRGLV